MNEDNRTKTSFQFLLHISNTYVNSSAEVIAENKCRRIMLMNYHAELGILGDDSESDAVVSTKLVMVIRVTVDDDFINPSETLEIEFLAFVGKIRKEKQNPP